MIKVKDTETFINKANEIHFFMYDYSKVNYIKSSEKITIICKIHGEFSQRPNDHLNGQHCPYCSKNTIKDKLKMSIGSFLDKAKYIHGDRYDYQYSLYINYHTKIKIICKIDNFEFYQSPANHLSGKGCPFCYKRNKHLYKLGNLNDFIDSAKLIHGINKYDYSKFIYINAKNKSIIKCIKHDREFSQSPTNHLSGKGCPICNESIGEKKIRLFLENNNIKYETQKRFIDCKNFIGNKMLPFDFYIPKYNICIEFDGIQHYIPTSFGGRCNVNLLYEKIKENDSIKTKYCISNNIKLIRISYLEIKNIENILSYKIN